MVGSEAVMRESSSTLPSLIGTLKSTRTKTRWPRRGRSFMESLATKRHKKHKEKPIKEPTELKTFARDVLDQVADAAGIAPLVVVPRKHLQHPATDHFRVFSVDDRRVGVAFEVD